MSLKIAILGSAPSSCKLAPFNDPSWNIWACSPQNYVAPRVDAWFEIHSIDRKNIPGNEPYIAALKNHSRVYVSKEDYRLPNAILYPKKEVWDFYGTEHGPLPFMDTYMQSSVSYMLAYAIMQKPEVIGLWGVDMAATDEYGLQRPGCQHFFNEAYKRGIEVVAPPQSDILEPIPLYGFKEHLPMYWRQKARKMELMTAINDCQRIISEKQRELDIKSGALQDLEYCNNTWLQVKDHPRVQIADAPEPDEPKPEVVVVPDKPKKGRKATTPFSAVE